MIPPVKYEVKKQFTRKNETKIKDEKNQRQQATSMNYNFVLNNFTTEINLRLFPTKQKLKTDDNRYP